MSGFGFGARSGLHRLGGAPGGPRIAISAFSISEDALPGATVGALSVFAGSGNYSFSIPPGGDPSANFALTGANLVTTSALDFESAPFHQITIAADNGVDPVLSRSLIISVTNAFEQPDLRALSIDSEITQGAAVAITGATAGSTIVAPVLPAGWTLDGPNREILIANDAPTGLQNWSLRETLADSTNSPNVSNGSATVQTAMTAPTAPIPSASWDGTARSGFTSPPVDPVRTTAKPALRLIEPPLQYFTDTLTVGAIAMANNNGTLIDGVSAVRFYFENDTPVEVTEPTFRTLTRADGSTYGCLGYWVDLQKRAGVEGDAALFIEAIPADETMQPRVIGPFLYHRAAVLHDFTTTIGSAGEHATVQAGINAARGAGADNPLLTLLDNGDYAVSNGGAAYTPAGYVTIKPSDGITARLVLDAVADSWDPNVGRLWLEDVEIDLQTIVAIREGSGGHSHTLKRCRATRPGGAALWYKNVPGLSFFVEGEAYFLECFTDGIYEVGDQNALMRGTVNERGYGDITSACPCTLYNTFHDWDWLDIAPSDLGRMTIAYSGAGSSVTLARSYQSSGPLADRYRIFTLKVDGAPVLTFEAWEGWSRYAEPVTNDGGSPPTVRGYEVQHFVDAINALTDFSATLLNNDVAARGLNLQGSQSNLDFGDTEIIASTGSYDVIADLDLHAGGISGNSGENRIHLFDQITDFGEDLLWNYSGNPGYKDIIIAGCILDQGNDAFEGFDNLIASDYSHIVFAHNTVRGHRTAFGRSNRTSAWDSYCLVANNAAMRLEDRSAGATLPGANNHLEDGAGLGPNFTGTVIGGSTATWFPNADSRDFGAAGELASNPKPPVMVYDAGGNTRANPSFVGASSQAASAMPHPYVVVGILGQSNAAGTGDMEAQDVDLAGIAQYASNANDTGTIDTITSDITPLLHPRNSAPSNKIGNGDYFARQIYANGLVPANHRLLIVPCARGSTGMITGGQEWKPTAPLGSLMQNAIDQCTEAVNAARALNANSYFAGFLWAQGENEVNNSGTEAAYYTAFNQLVAQMRTNVPTATSAWALISSMVPDWVKLQTNGAAIQNAHMRLALDSDTIHFDQAPLGLDDAGNGVHFDSDGYRTFGAQLGTRLPGLIADPRLDYSFVGDADGDGASTPILGLSNVGATNLIIRSGTGAGLGAKCLSAAGAGTLSALSTAGAVFEGVGDQGDISVEWTANFAGRSSMVLRAQTGGVYNSTLGYDGYLIRIDGALGNAALFRISSASTTGLSGGVAIGPLTNPRFRASAIGNRLTLEVSTNGGSTWSTVIDETDSTFTSGGVCYMQGGNGTTGGQVFAENFVFKTALSVSTIG